MKSQNFEFLRDGRPFLADTGGFAEQYAHEDPIGSLVRQRTFVTHVVDAIYETYRLPPLMTDNLNDLMNAEQFRQSVPEVVRNKLHTLRKAGNQAAHPRGPIPKQIALDCLCQMFDVARWFYLQVDEGGRAEIPQYSAPLPPTATNGKAKEAQEKLRLAEAKYEALLADLDQETKKRLEAEKRVETTEAERDRFRVAGQQVATVLQFNEETTRRRLIDQALLETGWDVGMHGANTDQVRQEVQFSTMPTESGEGYADYVLYGDDGKPLAVIEAKKTAKDARVGGEQARIYALCLEKETGVRPVIFFTNGCDIFLWDDAQGYPYRKIYGFYSKDSLEYLLHQRVNKSELATIEPNLDIADRMYQLEAVKRVCERFSNKFRKALLVQATGTGKTRVAISLCDTLMRAGWVKRILFLCDRRELRRQADRVFKEYMPNEPRIVVSSATAKDRDKRIYLATYPAMMQCYEDFDVGFFDLIIADESHRSIYKKFRSIFRYFDALEIGLTATPVRFVERNTYDLFECADRDPTAAFEFEDAIGANPPFLSTFRVKACSTWARSDGFTYRGMNEEQKRQLIAQVDEPDTVDYDAEEIDKSFFNKGSTRLVWQSLMEEGIRDGTGSQVGKTIVFARSHLHAVHLESVFTEMYPQYGSAFCRVIDNQETRAEQLIDDFRNPANELTIAISVDMLDTGIDVHEIVNLVFAKPVKSYVKFWQMIGRGTRLCPNLFGPGRHKTEFLIFDHWQNFYYFDEQYKETQPSVQKSLLQKLFETRVAIAEAALNKMDEPVFQATVDLLVQDIRAAKAANSIEVRDRWRELEQLSERERVAQFAAVTQADLMQIAAPLMQWRNVRGEEDAYRFDLLTARLQLALVQGSPTASNVLDLKARVQEQVELLMKNQNPVKAKAEAITAVRSKEFWSAVTVPRLEEIRTELRGIMRYQQTMPTARLTPDVFDVDDADHKIEDYIPRLEGLDLAEYKRRVTAVIRDHFAENPVLQRIRAGMKVSEGDLEQLARLILEVDDKANVKHLAGHQPETRRTLLSVFRGLVGLDPVAVEMAFTTFVHNHPRLSSQQLRFLQVLQNHIAMNGGIEIERLYEPPFTTVHAESVDGVFRNPGEVDELLSVLSAFEAKNVGASEPPPASRAV